jgi:hypothetical protein
MPDIVKAATQHHAGRAGANEESRMNITVPRITAGPYRIVRRLARKAVKPGALLWTAWKLQKSRDDVAYLASLRAQFEQKEHNEALRQVRLMRSRSQIAGW